MTDDLLADTAVVIVMVDARAPAFVDGLGGDDDLVIVIFVVCPANDAAAGSLLTGKAAVCVHAGPPFVKTDWVADTPKRVRNSGDVGKSEGAEASPVASDAGTVYA
jgi:hypothetical protein